MSRLSAVILPLARRIDMSKCTLLVRACLIACLLLFARPSFGVLVAGDSFDNYSGESNIVGQNPTTTGFTGGWLDEGSGSYTAASSGLGYHNGSQALVTGDGSVQIIVANSTNRETERVLDNPPAGLAGTYFLSGIIAPPTPRAGLGQANAGFAMFQLQDRVSNLPADTFNIQFGVNAEEVRVRARSVTNANPTDFTVLNSFTPNENLFMVLKVEENINSFRDRISVWVNPSDLSSEVAAGPADAVFEVGTSDQNNANRAFDRFGFRTVNFDGSQTAAYDEFRAGTDWEAVTPFKNVEVAGVIADAHVNRASGGGNNADGNVDVMAIKNSASSTFERKIYMKFDISGFSGSVDEAALSLTMDHAGGDLDGNQTNAWTFNVFGMNDDQDGWDEGTITWNNAPGNDTGDGGAIDGGAGTLLGQFIVSGSPEVMLTLENLPGLADYLNSIQNGLATFVISRATLGDSGGDITLNTVHGIRSKEFGQGQFGAELIVSIAPVPEPTTAVLGLLGLAGLAARRRRVA